jgi:hypothetical protein
MAVEERRRAGLFEALAEAFGEEAANTMFELLPPAGHDGATTDDVERLGIVLRTDMEALRMELREEMGELRTELRGEMGDLRTEVSLLRRDMATQHAELLATFRQELNDALLRSNRSMVIGLASTLLAAITLAAILARFVA